MNQCTCPRISENQGTGSWFLLNCVDFFFILYFVCYFVIAKLRCFECFVWNAQSLPPVPLSDTCGRLCAWRYMSLTMLCHSKYLPPKSFRIRRLTMSSSFAPRQFKQVWLLSVWRRLYRAMDMVGNAVIRS